MTETKFNVGDRVRGVYEEGSLEALMFGLSTGMKPPYTNDVGVIRAFLPATQDDEETMYGVEPEEGTGWYGDVLNDEEVVAAREAFGSYGHEAPSDDVLRVALPNFESWLEKVED